MTIPIIHRHFKSINSTNTYAMAHYRDFDRKALTAISADEQTGGRGRYQRHWHSPVNGNIYVTLCLFLSQDNPHFINLPQIIAALACLLIEKEGLAARIKWPNDLFINKQKIGGLLTESTILDKQRFLAIGIGINANMDHASRQQIDKPATSLFIEKGKKIEAAAFRETLVNTVAENIPLFINEGIEPFYPAIKHFILTYEPITFSDGCRHYTGHVSEFHHDGSITFTCCNGETQRFYSGEITETH